jgi:DNA-binding transcriptional LysR family regulator
MQTEYEYILEVFKTGSFSKAAQNLFITQPALSIAIKKVEKEIHMPLFDRSHKPLTLTSAGKIFVKNILQMKEIENNITRSIQDLDHMESGELRLAGTQYLNSHVIPGAIDRYITEFPKVKLSLLEENSGKLNELLKYGLADMVLHCGEYDADLYRGIPFFRDRLFLAIPKKYINDPHILAVGYSEESIKQDQFIENINPQISLTEFSNVPFLFLTGTNDLRRRSLAICREHHFEPTVRFQAEQLETAYYLAAHGLGATFVSDILIKEHHFPNLVFYYLDSPIAVRVYRAIIHKQAYLSRHMKTFILMTRDLWRGKANYCDEDS